MPFVFKLDFFGLTNSFILVYRKIQLQLQSKIKLMQRKTLGIVVIVIGILMMIYTGFNYVTTERVVDLGPVKINAEKNHPVQWSPIVGAVLLVGGIVIVLTGKKV